MLNDLFTYDYFEQVQDIEWQFCDCVLVCPVGNYSQGDTIECISIDFVIGVMQFYTKAGVELTSFQLKGLQVLA